MWHVCLREFHYTRVISPLGDWRTQVSLLKIIIVHKISTLWPSQSLNQKNINTFLITRTWANKNEDTQKVFSAENTFKKKIVGILDNCKFLLWRNKIHWKIKTFNSITTECPTSCPILFSKRMTETSFNSILFLASIAYSLDHFPKKGGRKIKSNKLLIWSSFLSLPQPYTTPSQTKCIISTLQNQLSSNSWFLYWYLGLENPTLPGLSCALQDVYQHPRPLLITCQ